jgi:NAD(P)-dependent dehydrogenase (short-subunit alcohol dehydrogenase family)
MHPAWGMSETSSGITSSHKFQRNTTTDDMSFVEVGAPIPGISLRIVDPEDNLVQEDKIGRLQVQGSTITKGYYKNEELNREAFSKDGWFNTGDLGFLHEGCLTITGRTKDVIIINGINFYSHEIEGVVEEVKGVNVSFTAATAVREQGIDTDKLAIFFSPVESAKPANVSAEIRSHVLNRIGVNPDYIIPVAKDVIPKTAIGKIQRQHLRDRFEGGEFKQQLKQLDIESANARTVPDWFFRKCWSRREEIVRNSGLLKGSYLIFTDDLGLAEVLGRKLQEIGSRCVFVAPGPDFVKLDANHYRVNPGVGEHFRKLVVSLSESGAAVNNILHFWHYSKTGGAVPTQREVDEAQRNGIYSLLHTVQAVAASQDLENGLRLFVVANHTQPVTPTDTITPEKATVLGFLKTLPLELSWLRPRHIDLEPDSVDANAQRVWQELTIPKTRIEVAYRQGHRLVAALHKVNLLEQDLQPNAIKQNGVYLITGGLGGVGAELARFLSKRYQAKLILIGKTPLPPREEWKQHDNHKTELARRIKSLVEIEAAGGQVCYKDVDVCDLEGLRQAVAEAEERWGEQIAGVFHLAGGLGGETNLEQHWAAMESHRVASEDVENFQRAFLPKVFGTLALRELIKERPDTLFVLFSSVNSLFGGATFSAYSAANSFLDCYALHLSRTSHPRTYCFNWTMWDDIGMSRSNPEFAREATRNMGFFIMSKEQALNSLIAGLLRSEPQLVVGVDGHSRNASRELEVESAARQKLHAYFAARAGALASDHFAGLAVLDRFGNVSACAFQEVSELMVDQNGQIDREQLKDAERNQGVGTRALVGPRTDLEREIANIWRDVLRVPQIGIHDNFFQIGGQSLLATQVISRLRKALQINLPLSALFEAPTIAGLSVSIGQTRQATQPKGSKINALPRDKYRVSSGEVAS